MIRDFNRKDAQGALNHFKNKGVKGGHDKGLSKPGMLWGRTEIDADTALERLENGKDVEIPDRGDDYYEIDSMKELQVLDDLLGRQEGFALTADQAGAIMNLEKGPGEKDGLYDPGFFKDSRKDAFTAAQEILDGEELNVRIGEDKDNSVKSFDDIQELDAFQGSGQNTILPEAEFQAMTHYENTMGYQIAGSEDQKAYDALNSMQSGQAVGIDSRGRTASVASPSDAAELHALEGGAPNNDPTIEKLLHFEQAGGEDAFLVGGGEARAYESLQQIQDGRSVGVEAGGVHNSVSSSKDLSDLDDLLGRKQNQLLPDDQMSSLGVLTEGLDEGEGLFTGREPLNVYGGYKAIENTEKTPEYRFQGGDFNEQLSVPVEGFQDLSGVQSRVENQKEFDRYALSESEMKQAYAEVTDGLKGAFRGQFEAQVDKVDTGSKQMNEATKSGLELTDRVAGLPRHVDNLSSGLQELTHGYGLNSAVQSVRLSESHLTTAQRSEKSFRESSTAVDRNVSQMENNFKNLHNSFNSATRRGPQKPEDPRRAGVKQAYDRVKQDLATFKDGLTDLSKLRRLSGSVFSELETGLRGARRGLDKAQTKAPEMSNSVNELQSDFRNLDSETKHWNDGLGRADRAMSDSSIELTGLTSESNTNSAKTNLESTDTEMATSEISGKTVLRSLEDGPGKSQQVGNTLTEISDGLMKWPKKRERVENSRRDLEAEVRYAKRMPERIQRDLSALQRSITDFSNKILQATPELKGKAGQLIESTMDLPSGISTMKADMEILGEDSQNLFNGLLQVDSSVGRVREKVSLLTDSSKSLETGTKDALDQAKKTMKLQKSARSAVGTGVSYLETVPATQQAVSNLSEELTDVSSQTLGERNTSAASLGENSSGALKDSAVKAGRLLQTQIERPARPDGWVEPGPRI